MEIKSENYLRPMVVQLHGALGSGKSNLFNRYIKDDFKEEMSWNLQQIEKKIEIIDKVDIIIQLQDTAIGGDQSKYLNRHYRHPAVHILVCDMTSPYAWEKLPAFLKHITYYNESPIVYLVGTKADLAEDIRITQQDIADFALTNQLTGYHITSAKNNTGIKALFTDIAKSLSDKYSDCIEINELNPREKIINRLNTYIQRVELSKTKFGDIDFSQGFWFFSSSRAINREANYLLAKALVIKLKKQDGSFAEILDDVEAFRNTEIIGKNGLHTQPDFADRSLNSVELLSIIEDAKIILKRNVTTTSLVI